jgi:pyruvate/2-oxoglutarate dehydrogenase complex dihydrolipoamide dehydrogenase (E3) component
MTALADTDQPGGTSLTTMDFDLVVIGGGAAGLGAARAAVRSGARTLLVADGPPGGDCTFTGCVPSKTLIESARRQLPFASAMQRVRDVIARVAATENAEALRREGIDVIEGQAEFIHRGRIKVDGRIINAGRCVIATGATAAVPPIDGINTVPYETNETIFNLNELPETLLVLGGGPVGCELAHAFARLGSRVTVVQGPERLLPRDEPEASHALAAVFARAGITVHTGTRPIRVATDNGRIRLTLDDGNESDADKLLVAVGRQPTTQTLRLERIGVRLDERGRVVTDEHLATAAPGIYAAGDVTGRMLFTHAAFEMGRLAAGNALARRPWRTRRYRTDTTPWVTFTDPEVAHVGLTERQAAERGARVAYLPMNEMDRALAADATDGFIKLIAGPRRLTGNLGGGRLLGATIVAQRGGEMIHEAVLALATGMFVGRLAAATHAYPTWSYGVQLAAAQFFMTIGGRTARPAKGLAGGDQ